MKPGAQAKLEESLAAGVGELAVWIGCRVTAVLLRFDATVVQFRTDDLPLARVEAAKHGRFVVTLGTILFSVAAIPRGDANFLPSVALVVTRLASATARLYQHLQICLHRPLAPVLLCPTLVVAGVRLDDGVDDEGAGAAGTLLGEAVSLRSRLHLVVGKVPVIMTL